MNRGPLVRQMSRRQWWLGASRYRRYMVRELTSLLIGAFAFTLIVGLWRLSQGAQAFAAWLDAMHSPAGLAFNGITLAAALYHSVTWFNVAPKAISVRIGVSRLPDSIISGAHYACWVLVSMVVLYLVRI